MSLHSDIMAIPGAGPNEVSAVYERIWFNTGHASARMAAAGMVYVQNERLLAALKDALALLEKQEVQLAQRWGCFRTLEQIEKAGGLPKEITLARELVRA